MSPRSTGLWKSIAGKLKSTSAYTTATAPKMKPYAASAGQDTSKKNLNKGVFFPVFVSAGLIVLAGAIGLNTIKLHVMHSPNVHVKKSRREMVPEVVEPEKVAEESENLLKRSFFRKVAHVQDVDPTKSAVPASTHDVYAHRPGMETLKSVGVDPKS